MSDDAAILAAVRFAAFNRETANDLERESILTALVAVSVDEEEARAAQTELFHMREERKAQLLLDTILQRQNQGAA